MNAPTIETDKVVSWCPTCYEVDSDDPQWAPRHHEETGHETHRRKWTVERWGAP